MGTYCILPDRILGNMRMWEGKEEEVRIESVNWRDMETELAERSAGEVTVEEA